MSNLLNVASWSLKTRIRNNINSANHPAKRHLSSNLEEFKASASSWGKYWTERHYEPPTNLEEMTYSQVEAWVEANIRDPWKITEALWEALESSKARYWQA